MAGSMINSFLPLGLFKNIVTKIAFLYCGELKWKHVGFDMIQLSIKCSSSRLDYILMK